MTSTTRTLRQDHLGRSGILSPIRRLALALFAVIAGSPWPISARSLDPAYDIQGLTTAAGLWLVSAIGLASGGGMYWEAVAVTGLGTLALTVLRRFEDKDDSLPQQRRITLVVSRDSEIVEQVQSAVTELGGLVEDIEYATRFGEKRRTELRVVVRLPADTRLQHVVSELGDLQDVRRIHVGGVR